MTVRLLTNIGRLWTGTDVCSNAAILIHNDRIVWAGPAADLPQSVPGVIDDIVDVDHVENLGGGLVTPGLIDAHSHPVYAGNRWAELAMRTSGSTYSEIAAAGGGVNSTITVTRGTDPWTLCNSVRERLRRWIEDGTTTVEAKTGYHLTRDGELADIRMLRSLESEPSMPRVHATFLAAHILPPEYFGRRRDYVEAVRQWTGDAAAAGADSMDVYCDEGHFTPEEARVLLYTAKRVGLKARMHACANERTGAAQVAAEMGCASADILTHATDEDIKAIAHAGVTATVCPGSSLNTDRPLAPVRKMLDHGVTLALGTDHNPGQCGITSMPLVIGLAVAMFGLSVTEALRAATLGGAAALRVGDRGTLAPGMMADIVLWDADHEGAFAWAFGLRALRVWRGGVPVVH
ncbi:MULTISPECIES: imidazolonepropionase [Thermomonospora]|uniref:Imidazolonepropionase n=1 Tax=Thermomonospora curvata (strain ATCC 19995 / DSM 43183 / JCM 3096 / KCTC 9072 / NBRC 15933 / NCIMB 10081 / Henssen B9) TaxID=471852 RepID=D1AA94_THECD|nr:MULTISPECIES: imidazolonepropionase [Thermomonospora]ACY98807.1 imidazolonepropionase [Thermomonospora curvata DSM 43183]PKK13017.1 MAG: imidazolonepropionase [Thermomonospora sp. CIF 1]